MNYYRALFRKFAQKGSAETFNAISNARKKSAPEAYPALLKGFQIAAPAHHSLQIQRPKLYQDLLYNGPLSPVPLESEMAWAALWVTPAAHEINALCNIRDQLQDLFATGQLSEMLSLLETFIQRQGWSMWAVELQLALIQQLSGSDAVRAASGSLQLAGRNRASGLFALIFSDRNDDAFSFDSFQAKCNDSLSRYQEEWIRAYLPYRAMSAVRYPEQQFPIILGWEITSSIFDYYDAVIELLQSIRQNHELAKFQPFAMNLIDALIEAGIKDHRLKKIALGFEASPSRIFSMLTPLTSSPIEQLHMRLVDFSTDEPQVEQDNIFLKRVHEYISRCDTSGMAAQEELTYLLKLGINFKSLPIGIAIALKALQCGMSLVKDPIVSFGADLTLPSLSIEDLLANSDEHVIELLRLVSNSAPSQNGSLCDEIIKVVDGEKASFALPPTISLWLARFLANYGRLDEATSIITSIASRGGAWVRHAAKLRIYIYVKDKNLKGALEVAAEQLLGDSRYAHELPLQCIFLSHTWVNFKTLDSVLVGLVANYACLSHEDAKIRFICRMACRSFYINGYRDNLDEAWDVHTKSSYGDRLILFLDKVWTEENLALVESFKSTQEIRHERIAIFQKLLAWDPENAQEYSSSIKELTFDETLWRGLKQINETRIFVNEPAITRWAEKELLADFERWRQLRASPGLEQLSDDIIRNYLVGSNIEKLLNALPKHEVTESNTLLFDLLDRLLKRFVTDPTDGLDCYLSLRIRHGSLRGTLFGPLEQEGLLLSGSSTEAAFHERWDHLLHLSPTAVATIVRHLTDFTKALQGMVKTILDEKIQIGSVTKPSGVFPSTLDSSRIGIIQTLFDAKMSFSFFLLTCYEAFWFLLEPTRKELAEYFRNDVKEKFRSEFDLLVKRIRDDVGSSLALETTLMTVATATQSQCDAVADWFVPKGAAEKEAYPLSAAIEIAKKTTENVYRSFLANIDTEGKIDNELQLSASGLATLTDCLYVIFENAWKHSGLGEAIGAITLRTEFDRPLKVLKLEIHNNISQMVRTNLTQNKLLQLREKYLAEVPIHLVPKEGGSGFAKLARMAYAVDKNICSNPLDFGIDSQNRWYVKVVIPLYERDGVFDAYE